MIRQEINIERYDWHVWCYYNVAQYDCDEILDKLQEIGANKDFITRAFFNITSNQLDHGLCCSVSGQSVLMVGESSSPEQMANSLAHELHHLVEHICSDRGIPYDGEAAAYLCGDIMQAMWPAVYSDDSLDDIS